MQDTHATREPMHEPVVRGRDFTGYRIAGAIVAVLFGALLIWQVVYLFQGFNTVVPEVGWRAVAGASEGDAAGSGVGRAGLEGAEGAHRAVARPRGQRPRAEQPPPPLAVGGKERLVAGPLNGVDTATFPRAWSTPDEETLGMLRPRQDTVGLTAVPYANAGIFERPEGRVLRHGIADYTVHVGAVAILGVIALLGLVLAIRGRVPIAIGPRRPQGPARSASSSARCTG